MELNTGSSATRSAFLEHDWRQTEILHLSTHATAIAGTPEYAHLDLFPDDSRTGILHSFDILSLDLSHLQLVFLSACQTKLGSQWTGNEDLSLAWAFRAAGAKAVIGMRWEVSDVAAWYFSHRFYDAWLGDQDLSIREAFRLAQKAVREHPYFKTANLWGPFVLLD
ncbi:MAG: CHAT domain-containing protein [Planctomycetaceae bacterium]